MKYAELKRELQPLFDGNDWRAMLLAAAELYRNEGNLPCYLIADELHLLATKLQEAEKQAAKIERQRQASPWFKE